MVKKNYQIQPNTNKKIAKVLAKNLPISLKYSAEVVRQIKGKKVEKAAKFLQNVLNHEQYLPLLTYYNKIGHRRGEAKGGSSKGKTKVGKYPKNVAYTFIKLLKSLKANADNMDMDTDTLKITHAHVSEGFARRSAQPHGKISGKGRVKKSTHVEIMAMEA